MNKNLVFTATYNEVDNISTFLDIVLKIPNIDVLIVDDNSPIKLVMLLKNTKIIIITYFLLAGAVKKV